MHDTRRTRVILAVLLVAALALITVDYRDGSSGPLRSLRQAGGSVFGGVERGVSVVTSPMIGFFDRGSGPAGPARRWPRCRSRLSSCAPSSASSS